MSRRILITGCSGGGKSALIAELSRRGYPTVPEPGRRIVSEEVESGGTALPWIDAFAFASRAVDVARNDLRLADGIDGTLFFDRGLIDAAVALAHAGGASCRETLGRDRVYDRRVFLAPPWREIFVQDAERRHGLDAAEQEYARIAMALDDLGYSACLLPRRSVADRADFVLAELGL